MAHIEQNHFPFEGQSNEDNVGARVNERFEKLAEAFTTLLDCQNIEPRSVETKTLNSIDYSMSDICHHLGEIGEILSVLRQKKNLPNSNSTQQIITASSIAALTKEFKESNERAAKREKEKVAKLEKEKAYKLVEAARKKEKRLENAVLEAYLISGLTILGLFFLSFIGYSIFVSINSK